MMFGPETSETRQGLAWAIPVGLGAALLSQTGLQAADADVAKLPAKVRNAANAVAPGIKWSSADKERHEDQDVFELTGKNKAGQTVIVEVSEEAKVFEMRTAVPLADVPKTVWKAVAKKVPTFEAIIAYELRQGEELHDPKDGELTYEVSGVYGKEQQVILDITPDGEIAEMEKQVAVADVPKNVMAALKAKLPMLQVVTAFEQSEDGEVVGYQFTGRRGKDKKGKEVEVHVSADGEDIDIAE